MIHQPTPEQVRRVTRSRAYSGPGFGPRSFECMRMGVSISIPGGASRTPATPFNPASIAGYCWDLDADLGITLGSTPRATGTVPPACTLTGTLAVNVQLRIEITFAGVLGVALFRYSADGGATWIAQNVTSAATVALGGALSGVTLNMPAAAYSANNVYVGLVAAVADQSPSAAHVSNATSATQPEYFVSDANFNGHNAIDFAVLDSALNVAISLSMRHVFIVANNPRASTFDRYSMLLTATPGGGLAPLVFFGRINVNDFWPNGDDIRVDGVTTNVALTGVANAPHAYESQLVSLRTSSLWRLSADATSGRQWGGRVSRVIGYNVPVTGADLTGVRAYLKARYGTP